MAQKRDSKHGRIEGMSPQKQHRPSIEAIARRIKEQSRCAVPKLEEVYLESIRLNSNSQRTHIKVANIDWLLRAEIISKTIVWHRQLKLNKATLYDSVVQMDRYFSHKPHSEVQQDHELTIVAILYLCSKRVQKKKMCIKNWLEVINLKFTTQQIVQRQVQILEQLDYNLQLTNCFDFMSFLTVYMQISENTFMLARYFLELSFFIDYEQFYPFINCQALMAATSLYLSCFFLQPHLWNNYLKNQLAVSQAMLENCAGKLFSLIGQVKNPNSQLFVLLKPLEQKYMKKCYLEIASIQFESTSEHHNIDSQDKQNEELSSILDKSCGQTNTSLSNSANYQNLLEQKLFPCQVQTQLSLIKIGQFQSQETSEQEHQENIPPRIPVTIAL